MLELDLNPDIPISLSLRLPLFEAVSGQSRLVLQQALGDTFGQMLRRLGLPGKPVVVIEQSDEVDDLPFRLWINGRLCRYPLRLLQQVYWYLQAEPLSPGPSMNDLHNWLLDVARTGLSPEALFQEFFQLACAEIVRRQTAVLINQEQVFAYANSLPAPDGDEELSEWPPPTGWLTPALTLTLRQTISLADREQVAQVLQEAWQNSLSAADAAETLIDALIPDEIKVLIGRDDLQALTTIAGTATTEIFPMLRNGLFYELGMRYPAIRFTLAEGLKPGAFAFQINHLVTLPWIALPPGQVLVSEGSEALAERVPDLTGGRAARNPANDNQATLISAIFATNLEDLGYTTWDCWGYLVLALSSDLRQNSAALLAKKLVDSYIVEIESTFPALVDTFRAQRSPFDLARSLRRLLAEQIPILDMRRILERSCDYDYIVANENRLIVFDDRLATREEPDDNWLSDSVNLTEFTRQGLKSTISHKVTRGQNTLVVLLLDPELEDILRNSRVYGRDTTSDVSIENDIEEQILDRIGAELAADTTLSLAILTTSSARPALHALLAHALPNVPALAYQELSPEMNIQPLARITL